MPVDEYRRSSLKKKSVMILPRENELFYGARIIGWVLIFFSILILIGTAAAAVWDGLRSGYTFLPFFTGFLLILTIYRIYDMVCFDQ